MHEHHKRISEKVLDALRKAADKEITLDELEKIIASQISALDSTYPEKLRSELDHFVPYVYSVMTEFLDEPNEDEMVNQAFQKMISKIEHYLEI